MLFSKSLLLVTLATLAISAHSADQVWISDNLQTAVSASPDINGKFLGTLPAGAAVELLAMSKDKQYAHIKAANLDGWVSARNIQHNESLAAKYDSLNQAYQELNAQHAQITQQNAQSSDSASSLQQKLISLESELETVKGDYVALQRASANVVSIDKRNRELQTQTVALEQENFKLKRDNARFEESTSNRQMLVGGALVLSGFILHWLFGLFSMRRRHSSYDDL